MKQKNKKFRLILGVLLLLVLVFSLLTATGVFALMGDTTEKISLEDAKVSCQVLSDQSVKNAGNTPVFIRVKLLINWLDENGNVMAVAPAGSNYSIELKSDWTHLGGQKFDEGYWYLNKPLQPDTAAVIIKSYTSSGGSFKLTVLAEAIQSVPSAAVEEAWNVSYDNETWTEK